jgi:hypothetical protein
VTEPQQPLPPGDPNVASVWTVDLCTTAISSTAATSMLIIKRVKECFLEKPWPDGTSQQPVSKGPGALKQACDDLPVNATVTLLMLLPVCP